MAEAIAFISHFRIKPGKLEEVRAAIGAVAAQLAAAKPRTTAFLAYVDENGQRLSIVHLFPDAAAMDLHVEGAADRSKAAYELFEPAGWEIYGTPSKAARETIERNAADAGVTLTVEPDALGGFLRLGS